MSACPKFGTFQVLRPAANGGTGGERAHGTGKNKGKGKGKGQGNGQRTGRGKGRGKGGGKGGHKGGGKGQDDQGTAPNGFYRRSNDRDYDPEHAWRGGWRPREPQGPGHGQQARGHGYRAVRGARDERARRTDRDRDAEEWERYIADARREREESRARRAEPY